MANQRDKDRHRLGKDEWNKWADQNPGASVDFAEDNMISNFVGFVFPGDVNFSGPRFGSTARFEDAEFLGKVKFTGANFTQDAVFNNTNFFGSVDFTNVKFHSHCSFAHSIFSGHAIFTNAKFQGATNFVESKFAEGLSAVEAEFQQDAMFNSATSHGDILLTNSIVGSVLDFEELRLLGGLDLESVEIRGQLFIRSAEIYGPANLHRLTVSKEANFAGTSFNEAVHAGDATFLSDAWFFNTSFEKMADFSQSEFRGRTNFENAEFRADASFNSVGSHGPFSLADARFLIVPDFGQASFRAPPRLDNIEIPKPDTSKPAGNREVAARYRALKRLAIEGHDHLREQQFFAGEIVEQRGNDDKPLGPNAARFWFGYAYGLVSNFGRSIMSPLGWCFGLWAFFSLFYVVTRNLSFWPHCGSHGKLPIGSSAYLSFVNSMPFIGLGKADQIKSVSECLYGSQILPHWVTIVTSIQTILSTVLIFLFLLAVRNHFRIK